MKAATARLVLAAALFLGWIGWLAYLAATTTHPVVLARPQFLVAGLDVIAEVQERDGKPVPVVQVREVLWPRDDRLGDTLRVTNLPECEGWAGAGSYLLPLVKDGDSYRVPSIPRSPGFEPEKHGQPRIYPDTPQTREQEKQVRKP
jgi:hypothetical protein